MVAARNIDPARIPLTPKKVVLYIFPKNLYSPISYYDNFIIK
jgi:hypothetical protein